MIRRLFRLGLLLGLLAGVAFALRRLLAPPEELAPKAAGDQWQPLAGRKPAPAKVSEPLADAVAAEPPAVEPMDEDDQDAEANAPTPAAADRVAATWVDPDGNICPESHPIKGNAQSKIFHVPGGLSYDRTIPERCYESAAAAEADGFRQAKR